eukprot:UN13508
MTPTPKKIPILCFYIITAATHNIASTPFKMYSTSLAGNINLQKNCFLKLKV